MFIGLTIPSSICIAFLLFFGSNQKPNAGMIISNALRVASFVKGIKSPNGLNVENMVGKKSEKNLRYSLKSKNII